MGGALGKGGKISLSGKFHLFDVGLEGQLLVVDTDVVVFDGLSCSLELPQLLIQVFKKRLFLCFSRVYVQWLGLEHGFGAVVVLPFRLELEGEVPSVGKSTSKRRGVVSWSSELQWHNFGGADCKVGYFFERVKPDAWVVGALVAVFELLLLVGVGLFGDDS